MTPFQAPNTLLHDNIHLHPRRVTFRDGFPSCSKGDLHASDCIHTLRITRCACGSKRWRSPSPKTMKYWYRFTQRRSIPWTGISWEGATFLVRAGQGLRKPKDTRLGVDLAGRVEAVGAKSRSFMSATMSLGSGLAHLPNLHVLAENRIALKPTDVSYEAAAAVPISAVTALQGLRDKGHIQAGQQVLIQGASGAVGTFAVQIAKSLGADVTAVCSTRNVDQASPDWGEPCHRLHTGRFHQEEGKQRALRSDRGVNGYHPLSPIGGPYAPKAGMSWLELSIACIRALFQALLLGPMISRIGSKNVAGFLANPSQNI